MGLLRLANPLCANVSPPRKRTARAAEAIARDLRAALAETTRAANAATPAANAADSTQRAAAAIGAMIARGEHVPEADLELLRRKLAEVSA